MSASAARVLLAEDEEHLGNILHGYLTGRGHAVTVVRDGREALAALQRELFDVALLDVVMPEVGGLEILRAARALPLPPQVVMTTGTAGADTARTALALGAYEFVAKPYRMSDVEAVVRRACERGRLERTNQALRARLARVDAAGPFVTEYAPLRAVLTVVEQAARGDAPVLVRGEVGTGRRHLARLVHGWSGRDDAPLLAVRCAHAGAEASLFGVAPGARAEPGALDLAAGGTLVLEDVEYLSPELQERLAERLRGAGASGARLVATTAPETRSNAGRVAPALAAQLGVMRVTLPPLRERVVDIWPLALHFLAHLLPPRTLEGAARSRLEGHGWPGNIAELRRVMEVAAARAAGLAVLADDLPLAAGTPARPVTFDPAERTRVVEALERVGWRRAEAAAALGISTAALASQIRAFGLSPGGRP
ncbi:MAG TPA: response regulator [Gemmatimonadaceae bacterium]|nr:response regulator [Gemmatimonadaceae bacterium]